MKKFLFLITLFILTFGLSTSMLSAQDIISSGCSSMTGAYTQFPVMFGPDKFYAGEQISIGFDGPGGFAIGINGMDVAWGITAPEVFHYTIPDDGVYTIEIIADNNATPNSSLKVSCLASDKEPVPDYPPGTICHYPPGNPDASHTLVVGENAVKTHIEKHGDTLGPCPNDKDTRVDVPDDNIVVYIIPSTGTIEVYTDCNAVECENSMVIVVAQFIDFLQLLDENSHFILFDKAIPFESQGTGIVLYYLHPHPNDPFIGIFQLNIYQDNVLVDDEILIFIEADGLLLDWLNHDIWGID